MTGEDPVDRAIAAINAAEAADPRGDVAQLRARITEGRDLVVEIPLDTTPGELLACIAELIRWHATNVYPLHQRMTAGGRLIIPGGAS